MTFLGKSSFLLFLFIISFSIPSNAVIDYKPDAEKKNTIIKKQKKAKKKGLFKRWKERLILKKLKKQQNKIDDKTISKYATRSLKVGKASFISLILGGIAVFTTGSAVFSTILLITAILAIYGNILSLSTLSNTKHDPEKYKEERRKAKKGLIFSLLTGIIPLIAFLIFLQVGAQ
jgi:hypothetical protein